PHRRPATYGYAGGNHDDAGRAAVTGLVTDSNYWAPKPLVGLVPAKLRMASARLRSRNSLGHLAKLTRPLHRSSIDMSNPRRISQSAGARSTSRSANATMRSSKRDNTVTSGSPFVRPNRSTNFWKLMWNGTVARSTCMFSDGASAGIATAPEIAT